MRSTTLRTALAAGAASLLAAGCISVSIDTDLTVSSDDTVSGTLDYLISLDEEVWQELLEEEGEAALGDPEDAADDVLIDEEELEQFREDYTDSRPTIDADILAEPEGPFDDSGLQFTFDNTPFDEFNSFFEELAADEFFAQFTLTRDGDQHEFEGYTITEEEMGGDDPMEAAGLFELETGVSITFAGDIVDADGDIDGTTVTWNESGAYSATAVAGGDAPANGGNDATEEEEELPEETDETDVENGDEADEADVENGDEADDVDAVEDDADEGADEPAEDDNGLPWLLIGGALLLLLVLIGGAVALLAGRSKED